MTGTVKRKPVRKAASKQKKQPKKPAQKKGALKISKNPFKDFDAAMKTNGVVEVLRLSEDDCIANVKLFISTQSLELDRLLNGRGVACGRVTEVYGPEHIGKSTILDHLFAEVQKMGGLGVLFDTETSRDRVYTEAIGVDTTQLRYMQFDRKELNIENVITKIYEAVEYWSHHAPDVPVVIGWDALAGTATRDEMEKRLEGEHKVAQAASVLRKAARQIPAKLAGTKIAVVICNHEYTNIKTSKFDKGPARETYGGGAVRHLATNRIQLYHKGLIKKADGFIVGRELVAKLIKNRLGNPWGTATLGLLSGVGIDNTYSLYSRLKEAGIITVNGSWAAIDLDKELISFQGWSGLSEKCALDDTLFPRLVSVYQSLD